jgi:diketogulonate reductase-like aldo/keto reductase
MQMPLVGLGTWQLVGPACRDAVEQALVLGYRHVDTAAGYDNESEIGEGIRRSGVPRDRIFVTSKVWVDDLDEEGVRQACEGCLQRLATGWIDAMLVHWPPRRVPLEVSLEALFELQRAGTIRYVGVSNFPCRELASALAVGDIYCNQIEYHPYLRQAKLAAFAHEHGVRLTAYSPLARGAVLDDPLLIEIAFRHGKSPAQVALRWLLQKPGTTVIPKAGRVDHQRRNLDVFDFTLDDLEMHAIDGLSTGMRLCDFPWAPCWDA